MIEFEMTFRDGVVFDRCAREGWGDAEPMGAWMTGPVSRLVLPPPPRHDAPFELRCSIAPMLLPGVVESQRLRIVVNGTPVFETAMTRFWSIACPVPAEVIASRPHVEIVFEHPDARSTSEPGAFGDLRLLACSIWSLTLLSASPLPDERAPTFSRPVFVTRPFGNLANRMIQHMVALAVQAQAPACILSGMELDEWGIRTRPDDGTWSELALVDLQRIDVAETARLLNSRSVIRIVHRGYGQRMENFLPRAHYRHVFVSDAADVMVYDERHLLMNVRSGDVVAGLFLDYVLTPIAFYRDLIALTGLIPVFMGQLEPNAYTDALRQAFPDALFHDSQGAVRDFETVRRAANIVVSVSTFSWLAAWLSDAVQIHLPVNGLLNPMQYPSVDLLPLDDPRYRFWLFPINHAAPDFEAAHRGFDGQWREVSADELARIVATTAPWADAPKPASPQPAGELPPMLEDVRIIVDQAEAAAERGYAVDVLYYLRRLGLLDFAELMWTLPRADLPGISRLLPAMAPEEAQIGWNGKSGTDLRNHTVDFVRILAQRFQAVTGRTLENTRMLDFGCGWGRVTRLLYYHTDPLNCCLVDAMHLSIERCRVDQVGGRLVQSDYLPEDLDVGDRRYDLIHAFSVFTHTSLPAARMALAVLRRKLRNNGLLAITVRPVEFWLQNGGMEPQAREAHAREHREHGFSYLSLGVTAANGQETYGETSMSTAWIAANFPDWEVEGTDRGLDPLQLIVFLTPR